MGTPKKQNKQKRNKSICPLRIINFINNLMRWYSRDLKAWTIYCKNQN